MFHVDRGLFLTDGALAIDCRRRQARGFISHAHSDHMARHALALATPATSRLYQLRMGRRDVLEMPFGQSLEWGLLRLTTFPAGHCLGSAMLLAECEQGSLLYTGDFQLARSQTAEAAEFPTADVLILESTYGDPRHRHPPREEAEAQLVGLVRLALAQGRTPIVQAYALGKAQEVTRLLTRAGIAVLQERSVFEVSQAYQALGMPLGEFALFPGYAKAGHAVVVPPRMHRQVQLRRLGECMTICVTGWAAQRGTAARWGADYAVPLSDHADFEQLCEAVARVAPREVYCTHGVPGFYEHLRRRGWNAKPLDARACA